MLSDSVREAIVSVVAAQFGLEEVRPIISLPDAAFGDLSTNVAHQLAGRLKRPPQDIAVEIATALSDNDVIEEATATNGFINIKVSDAALWRAVQAPLAAPLDGQTVVAEYSDPNPFKALHAGHLYTTLVGDVVANLLETAGAEVHRVNFGGDVGLHVGKSMWAILKELGGEHPDKLEAIDPAQRPKWLSARYVEGTTAYEDDSAAKSEIEVLNQRVYALHEENDRTSDFARIYWTCRQWSYDGFDELYSQLKVKPFEKYYPESQTASQGATAVRAALKKGIFEESDGAVIYRGEQDGLHTRVFINSLGLPTYEAKDYGLALAKWEDYHFDLSFIITANDIIEYMKVVLAALGRSYPELPGRTRHLTHGMIRLAGGAKMSSRRGNILQADEVLEAARQANLQLIGKEQPDVVLAAVKYAFLRQRLGGDIAYEPDESVSLSGNSGPYLQYAHARARSILAKAGASSGKAGQLSPEPLQPAEHQLLRQLEAWHEVVAQAVTELLPHGICTYLYELSQQFNRFYENNQVVGDERQAVRIELVRLYADRLREGLGVLGIPAPNRL